MRHWLWASLLLSSTAFAMELGEISVTSDFNQPLVATIPLDLPPGAKASDYTISLEGLPSGVPAFIAKIVDGQKPYIKLSTAKPLSHNHVKFDLIAKGKSEQERQSYVIAFNKTTASKSPRPLIYGPVKEGETLWNVAKAFSEHYKIPVDEAMEQLVESNPKAFVKNHKDSLMAGSYLRLSQLHKPVTKPKLDKVETKAKPATKPKEPVVAQTDLKSTVNQELASTLPELPEMKEGKEVAVNMNQVSGSLELLVPKSETVQNILGKDDQAFVKLLDNIKSELAMSREAIDTERRAKEALQAQLTDMQIQLKALTELINLKDEEVKSLLTSAPAVAASDEIVLSESVVPRFAPIDPVASSQSSGMGFATDNQFVLLLMAVAVASALLYLGDHLASRRNLRKLAPAAGPTPKPTATLKTQPLQQPPFLLQDVDVYVAHGRYSQAEDMLEQALSSNPNDFDILYKLFQVYVKSDNRFAYENKIGRISARWKQKFPARWKRIQDLYERAWPMGFEGSGTGGGGGDDAYEGDPPSDPVQTKLDLAKAYIDIGNHENAVEILIEVVNEGNEGQVLAAQMLLSNIKH